MWDETHDERGYIKLNDGSIVEHDVLNIIQKIMAYDENLKVQFLDRAAKAGDAPWRLIERCNDGEWRTIFYVWEMDERVLDRLRLADRNVSDIFGNIEANNASLRKEEGRRFQEEVLAEAHDLTAHILKSPKGRYTFKDGDKKVTIDDDPKSSWKVEEVE